ncbi:MAG: hypothetical protein K2M13_01825 [Muribaculaceae bacterium]|nr:hypothetical protein [Muribaculaceae bacterium]
MDLLYTDLNFNSVENLPGFEARAAFSINSASVFRDDVDIVHLLRILLFCFAQIVQVFVFRQVIEDN